MDLFRKFDSSGDGQIAVAEFKAGLAELGFSPPEELFQLVMTALDSNHSGDLNLKEMDRSLRKAEKIAKAEGRSLEEAARKCGLNLNASTVSKEGAGYQRKRRSSVQAKKPTPVVADATDPLLMKVVDALNERKFRPSDYFRKWDISGDNSISAKELRIGLNELGVKVSEAEFASIMARIDKDASGDVSIVEFDKALKQVERTFKALGGQLNLPEVVAGVSSQGSDVRAVGYTSQSTELGVTHAKAAPPNPPIGGAVAPPSESEAVTRRRRHVMKKVASKPLTMGVAPSMCQPPHRETTPPLWASILGLPAAVDAATASAAEKSSVSVKQVFRSFSSLLLEDSYAVSVSSPVEERQRAEWCLKHLEKDMKLQQVKYRGLLMNPGKHMTSQCVVLAGVQGFLRFWPNGFFNPTQSSRFKSEHDLGGMRADSWCAVGLFMPPGTHFKVRFFVGEERSEPRDFYWSDGSMNQQIWMPHAKDPPKHLEDLVVGVEVFKNCRHLRPYEAKPLPLRSSPRSGVLPGHMGYSGAAQRSPRQLAPLAPMSPRMAQPDPAVGMNVRSDLGLALPSPRFMCHREIRRMPARCDVAQLLLS